MSVKELTRAQLTQLKGNHLDDLLYEREGRGASYGELAMADELVSDEEVFEAYEGYVFSEEDFSCESVA